jgi:putative restriction endonuclease
MQSRSLVDSQEACVAWLHVWKRRGLRAPHKPLLMLVALSELRAGRERLMTFPEIDRRLAPLLRKYTSSKSVHTEYPFWRLQRDGVWEVPNGESLARRASNSDPLRSELLQKGVRGGFTEVMFSKLRLDEEFRSEFVEAMLRHFPAISHKEVLHDVGL